MTKAKLLPWPVGFARERRRYGVLAAAVVGIPLSVLVFLAFVGEPIAEGSVLMGVFGGTGALACAGFAIQVARMMRPRRHTVPPITVTGSTDGTALFLPSRRRPLVTATLFLIVLTVWMATYLYLYGTVWEPAGEADFVWNYAILLASLAIFGFGGYAGLALARTWRHPLGITIGSDGVTAESGGVRQYAAWDDIDSIRPVEDNHTNQIFIRSYRLVTERRSRMLWPSWFTATEIRLLPDNYRIDPALLYYLLVFYATHPQLRGELTSAAAVRRIHSGDLLDGPPGA